VNTKDGDNGTSKGDESPREPEPRRSERLRKVNLIQQYGSRDSKVKIIHKMLTSNVGTSKPVEANGGTSFEVPGIGEEKSMCVSHKK